MTTTRPYAFNTGSTISGTVQSGNIAIGTTEMDYSSRIGDVTWWMGPDEDIGYVITGPVSEGTVNTPTGENAFIEFWRTTGFSQTSLLSVINSIAKEKGHSTFNDLNNAENWFLYTIGGYISWRGEWESLTICSEENFDFITENNLYFLILE